MKMDVVCFFFRGWGFFSENSKKINILNMVFRKNEG